MDMHPDQRQDIPAAEEPQKPASTSTTPIYVRVLALLGALAVIALSVAYAYSIATGGIFWF